jgi:Transposase DDE domain
MKIRKAKSTIPDSFILIISHIRVYFHLPYRQTEGIIKATVGKSIPEYKRPPSYSQICRRINKLDIDINSSIDDDDDDVVIIIARADSTGIKVTNRGLGGCKISGI